MGLVFGGVGGRGVHLGLRVALLTAQQIHVTQVTSVPALSGMHLRLRRHTLLE
jgi:hypothetical protein